MPILEKKKRTLLPSFVTDIFNTEKLLPTMFEEKNNKIKVNNNENLISPNANIIENDHAFIIEVAAPGFECRNFNVEIDNSILTISAESENQNRERTKNYRVKEFSCISFMRSFVLPSNSFADRIDATYDNGILHLLIPKREILISRPDRQNIIA